VTARPDGDELEIADPPVSDLNAVAAASGRAAVRADQVAIRSKLLVDHLSRTDEQFEGGCPSCSREFERSSAGQPIGRDR
jgi:hypothetical protein